MLLHRLYQLRLSLSHCLYLHRDYNAAWLQVEHWVYWRPQLVVTEQLVTHLTSPSPSVPERQQHSIKIITLCSASSFDLMQPRTIRSTIGERSFQSAAASTWNTLPRSVRSSTLVFQFRSRLKTELFARSYQQSYWICLCVTVTQHFCSVIFGLTSR